MSVTMRIDGGEELQRALAALGDEVREATGRVVQETAQDLEAAIKLEIQQGAKTGRVYRRGGVSHRASAPGEAPASDTGTLIGSIQHERENAHAYSVGSRLDYAAFLEYGTSRMAARPFFRPAAEAIKPVFRGRLEAIVRGAIA
jgi:HK97 gp10 family phage protein